MTLTIRRLLPLLSALALALLADAASAQTDQPNTLTPAATTSPKPRPKVALVLSGGGARGFAHVGVLRVLKDLRVPVDIVVGTSMGAVVGGSFAAGRSVEELERITQSTSWDNLLSDRPDRDELDFRRKEDDTLVRSRIEFQVSRDGLSLPSAIAGNSSLESALNRLLPASMRERSVKDLALPFRSVASDLLTGDKVDLVDVPLFLALRASLSVPGVFAPVRLNKQLLVDGGLVRNLPVDMARAMGADVIIAVNVGTPLATESELGSALGVANQMLQILTEQNVQRSIKELTPSDILIAPDLNGISFLDFSKNAQAVEAGRVGANKVAQQLARLSVPQAEYASIEAHRVGQARVTVAQNTAPLDPLLATPSESLASAPPSNPDHESQPLPKHNESQRLRVGLEVESDFSQTNAFTLKGLYTIPGLNAYGGEWRTAVQVGATQEIQTEWWQPLGVGSPWYSAAMIGVGSGTNDFVKEGRRIARVSQRGAGANVALGRLFGSWGDLRAGVSRLSSRFSILIPEDPANLEPRQYATSQYLEFKLDTLDALEFPTRGNYLNARFDRTFVDGTNSGTTSSLTITGMSALQVSPWAGHLYGEWSRAQFGSAPLSLGGFLRLSGTAPVSLDGQTVVFGRMVLARQIGLMPGALGGGPVRLGFSLETGAGFQSGQSEKLAALKQAAAGFLSVDTRLGHLYFGAGSTRGGGSSLYLFFGPTW